MTVQTPIPDFTAARAAMVENQLRPEGVTDPLVLDAMGSVPREKFVSEQTRPLAYIDRAVLMGDARFLPAPAVLGALLAIWPAASAQRRRVSDVYAARIAKELSAEQAI